MDSDFLRKLSADEKKALIEDLWEIQKGLCFITEQPIDLKLHKNDLDIDHIVPRKLGGKDDKSNFALTFASANRSKQASDLKLARILYRYQKIKNEIDEKEDRNPNLNDLFVKNNGSKFEMSFTQTVNSIKFSPSAIGRNEIIELPVYQDNLSSIDYFFTCLPIEFLFHDEVINPRSIGDNISKLVNEFYNGNPQLHISLAWIDTTAESTKIRIFDGQHKAAAQILLGVREIPVRVFINPDKDKLIGTNFRAGTVLRQIAFDKSVQRHLGNTLYKDRVERYQKELELDADNLNFSEKELINYFKGESREMKRYILDAIRDGITRNPDNKLTEFIDFGGRGKEKPLSYSTIEKTFYSFFIYQEALDTPISYRLEEGRNPRELEKSQILELMNIIAEEIYHNKFDLDLGTYQIENKIQKGERIDIDHIKAFRMSKEEIIYTWLKFIEQIAYNYFTMQGKPVAKEKLFQYEFETALWNNIRTFIKNLGNLPLWVNNELSSTVFGGKQNYNFWQNIFETGKSSQGVKVLAQPLNLIEMIKPLS